MNENKNGTTGENNREKIIFSDDDSIDSARQKKVQGFQLNIDNDWLKDDSNVGTAPSSHAAAAADKAQPKAERKPAPTSAAKKPTVKRKTASEKEQDAYSKAAQAYDELFAEDEQKANGETKENAENGSDTNAPEMTGDLSSFSDEDQKQKMNKEEREALKSYRKSEKKRKKAKAEKNGCMFRAIWLTMVLIIAIVFGQFIWKEVSDLLGQSREDNVHSVAIELPENATLDQVVDILMENELIKEPQFFKLFAHITKSDGDYMAGMHNMDSNMDYEAILNALESGRELKETVSIQFKEGLSVRECAQIMEDKKVCTAEQFMKACNSDEFDDEYDFVKAIKPNADRVYKLEGYLFPDTYDFYIGEDPADSVRRFLDNFKEKVYTEKAVYSGYDSEMSLAEVAQDKGYEMDDIVNMASLVQAEAANEKDMFVISSVFYNRIATEDTDGVSPYGDMDLNKLKSDATLYYPYASDDDIPQDLRATFKSKYNTYDINGMPPGAICNPGIKAIEAAIMPDSTNYYYFCHKAATTTSAAEAYYASTYAEHLINMEQAGLSTTE